MSDEQFERLLSALSDIKAEVRDLRDEVRREAKKADARRVRSRKRGAMTVEVVRP